MNGGRCTKTHIEYRDAGNQVAAYVRQNTTTKRRSSECATVADSKTQGILKSLYLIWKRQTRIVTHKVREKE